jgi:hypothetical protein
MAVITLIIGLFVAGFAAWYTVWHRRLASRFARVPVKSGRPPQGSRQGVEPGREPE